MNARRDGLLAEDEFFYAQQNAQTVRDAENTPPCDVRRSGHVVEPA